MEISRRTLLGWGLAGSMVGIPGLARAAIPAGGERRLSFRNLHTGEKLTATYWVEGDYRPDSLAEINHILRDHRTDEEAAIDPGLLDLLWDLHGAMDSERPFHIISGYRSPKTNAMLRQTGGGGVAKKSLHMQGMAVDIRLPGRDLRDLHRVAKSLRRGGVGYYGKSNFVHVDVGRVRYW